MNARPVKVSVASVESCNVVIPPMALSTIVSSGTPGMSSGGDACGRKKKSAYNYNIITTKFLVCVCNGCDGNGVMVGQWSGCHVTGDRSVHCFLCQWHTQSKYGEG